MKKLNKVQLYNRTNALFSAAPFSVCLEVVIAMLHSCAKQVPVTEVRLAKALVALLEPVMNHLRSIADQPVEGNSEAEPEIQQ